MAIDPQRNAWNRTALEASPFDALVCIAPSNVLLLSGYWPVTGNSLAILTRSGQCRIILPEDEQDLAEHSTNAEFQTYQPGTLDKITTPVEQFAGLLTQTIHSLGLERATIGLELCQTMQPASYASSSQYHGELLRCLRSRVPDCICVSADSFLATLQARRTPIELDILLSGVEIAKHGFAAAPKAIRVGSTEPSVAAAVSSAFQQAPQPESIQRSYGFFFCMSGPNSAKASAAYARTRTRTIETDDLVMVHANTCADGLWTDITRTYTAGEPTDRHHKMREAITAAREAALRSIRPGVPAAEVDRAARDVMQQHGYGHAFRHGTGHGVGLSAISANAQPRIHPASPDTLEEGMTFNVEPAAYFDGYGGMRHCDVVAVTATGAEVLTSF